MPTPPPPPPCDEGWTSFNDSCYVVVQQAKSWDEASDHCGIMGSYLLEITSDAERDFVEDTLTDIEAGEKYWIGATYRVCEGKFKYRRSGEPVPEYWAPGQPNETDEPCVYMSLSDGVMEFYDEHRCLKFYFVCEKAKM